LPSHFDNDNGSFSKLKSSISHNSQSMNKQSNAETATDIGGSPAALQEQQQKPNVQDEPTAESAQAPAAQAALEPQAGGGSAPSPCSAEGVSDKEAT
jgi:hypothetical protein